jgi:hypothetical protein
MLGFFDSLRNRTAERRSSAAEGSELPTRRNSILCRLLYFALVRLRPLELSKHRSIGSGGSRRRRLSLQSLLQFHIQIGSVVADGAVKVRIENARSEEEVVNLGIRELLSSGEVNVKEG